MRVRDSIGLTRNLLVKNRCNETIREDLIYAFKTCLNKFILNPIVKHTLMEIA